MSVRFVIEPRTTFDPSWDPNKDNEKQRPENLIQTVFVQLISIFQAALILIRLSSIYFDLMHTFNQIS